MHFYTYDEWVSHDYYTQDNSVIYKGHSAVYDLSSNSSKTYLTVRSCWRDPKFVSDYQGVPEVVPKLEPIDLGVGCLYKLQGNTNEDRSLRGCIQRLGNQLGRTYSSPYIEIAPSRVGTSYYDIYEDKYEGLNKEILTIYVGSSATFEKILIFQGIYSGAIAFQDAQSSLEFYFSNRYNNQLGYNYQKYDYKINTCINSNDSLMVVGAMLTLDTVGSNRYLLIDSICEPVYGHVDMDNQYDWNLLWETYQPSAGAQYMESSIMHQARS